MLNSTIKLERSLKQFYGITKRFLHFLFWPLSCILFKTESDLNYNYKSEINKNFLTKNFDKLVIFEKAKETEETQNCFWTIFS